MRASLVLVCLVIGCSSSETPATNPQVDGGTDVAPKGPLDLQVDTYNVALAGAGVAQEAERRPRLIAELGKLAGDIACLQEVWREGDKTALRDAMKTAYPHSAWPKTTRATPVEGAPKTAPCAGVEADLDKGVACVAEKCTGPDGKVTTTECAKEQCLAAAATIFAADNKACYACFASNLATEKISDIGTVCKAPGLGLGFGGESSPLLVSKHPLKDVEQLVLPGCWQQRSVIRATATLPNGADVDIYCNHLSPVIDDTFIPYACPWGGAGTSDKARWEGEQLLQAQKILAWAAMRPKSRTIFLGDLNSSPVTSDTTIESHGAATLELLTKTYVQALAPGFVPKCTFCRTNPLTGGGENTWLDHVLLGGIDKSAVKSTVVTFDQGAPMSDHFGLRVVVTVAP